MRNPQQITIGKLAHAVGIPVQTVRYYERRGLLAEPRRARSGYRLYDNEALRRLRFIRQAQSLGFSLSEIEELLSLKVQPGKTCADIRQRAREKIVDVENRIAELQRIRLALSRLAAECSGDGPTAECPILEALEHDGRAR